MTVLALLSLLVLTFQSAHGLRHSRQTNHIAVLPPEASPILDKLAARSVIPQYELVILRFAEDLSEWVNEIPLLWEVTVLNKGAHFVTNASRCNSWFHVPPAVSSRQQPLCLHQRDITCRRPMDYFHCPQQNDYGREGELVAAFIWQRWENLANYTAFCQGDPFVHNPEYLQLLQQATLLNRVQTMSYVYKENATDINIIKRHQDHPLFRSETISLRTLDSVYFRYVLFD